MGQTKVADSKKNAKLYQENLELEALFDLLELGLADQAMIILERATKTEAPQLSEKFDLVGTKIYGDTAIHWIEFNRQH